MNHQNKVKVNFAPSVRGRNGLAAGLEMMSIWRFVARDKDGNIIRDETVKNLVTNAGLNDLLDKYFKGSTYTAAFYVGLTDGTPTANAADTMSSHAGWAEVTAYDEATREALTLGTVASQSVDNSASAAQFTISADSTTIGGAFLTTNNTKGGTTGTLYGIAAFGSGDLTLNDGSTLDVTVTLTAASA